MKKNIIKSILFLTALVVVVACDVISPDDYITPVVGTEDSTGIVTNKRVVLIEEFTGHRCPNCPNAATEATKIAAMYPEQVIVMAIHSGFFAMPLGEFTADYRTTEGTEIFNYFGAETFPNSTFCRLNIDGSFLVPYQSWEALMPSIVEQEPVADVIIANINYSTETKEISITVNTNVFAENSLDVNVAAFLLENDIESAQAVGETVHHNYKHQHVLRAAFAGAWGEAINGLGVDSKTFSLTVNNDWNIPNCEIVAYIYNTKTMEILQAVKTATNTSVE